VGGLQLGVWSLLIAVLEAGWSLFLKSQVFSKCASLKTLAAKKASGLLGCI